MVAAATPDPSVLATVGLGGGGLIAAHLPRRTSSSGEGQEDLAERRTPPGFFSNPLAVLSPWRRDG